MPDFEGVVFIRTLLPKKRRCLGHGLHVGQGLGKLFHRGYVPSQHEIASHHGIVVAEPVTWKAGEQRISKNLFLRLIDR